MVEWNHRFGHLVFDRDAIVRAALRAYVESVLRSIARFSFAACASADWTGDLKRGAFRNDDLEGNSHVVAWTETGVVGLAYELGFGPIEQLGLSTDAVTGGPDDVRGALPGLPAELEPALVMATGMLDTGAARRKGDGYVIYGEKLAGVGFWLHGNRIGGTLFDDPSSCGADQLASWGLLRRGRLLPPIYLPSRFSHPSTKATLDECDRRDAHAHAIMDAVVDRRLNGPAEFTHAELEALLVPLPTPPPKRLVGAQRMLRKVGITWPGSPKIPEPRPRPKGPHPFSRPPKTVRRDMERIGPLGFDRDAIVRAAKRACVEAVLAHLDPLKRYPFTACIVPKWIGNLEHGAFYNGNGVGSYEVIAWNELGIVGLGYEYGYGPIEQLGLTASAVKGGSDDVHAALPELPTELESALDMAVNLLETGLHGEKLAGVGFWLRDAERVAGTLFDHPTLPGAHRLARWGRVAWGTLLSERAPGAPALTQAMLDRAEATRDLVEAVAERALAGPTELTAEELATLLPTPPDPARLSTAQQELQKVGVHWPGLPEVGR